MGTSRLHPSTHTFAANAVCAEVEYRVLAPEDLTAGEHLPLVLHLHGAMSSSAALDLAEPFYQELYADGAFPRAVIACPSTPTLGGFYLDHPGGPDWERLVAAEFPAHLAETIGPFSTTAVLGASMGGFGALELAFADPARYAAVAAISPAIFPGETPESVPERNIPSVLGDLHRAMGAGTDPTGYRGNSVYGRARDHAGELRAERLPILVDCGAADEFLLHDGARYLHDVLDELGVDHVFRLVEGAGHVDALAEERTREAIRFLGTSLQRNPRLP
jgi:S-formylglutathione hydrolase